MNEEYTRHEVDTDKFNVKFTRRPRPQFEWGSNGNASLNHEFSVVPKENKDFTFTDFGLRIAMHFGKSCNHVFMFSIDPRTYRASGRMSMEKDGFTWIEETMFDAIVEATAKVSLEKERERYENE